MSDHSAAQQALQHLPQTTWTPFWGDEDDDE